MNTEPNSNSSSSSSRIVPYRHTCDTCGKAFQRSTGLERHRRSAHTHENPYACEFCLQTFSRIDLLQRHVSLYHKTMAAAQKKDETFDKTIEMILHSQQVNHQRNFQPQTIQDGWNQTNSHNPINIDPNNSVLNARRSSDPQGIPIASSSSIPLASTSAPTVGNDTLNNMLQWLSNGLESDHHHPSIHSNVLPGFPLPNPDSSPIISNEGSFNMFASKTQSNPSTIAITPASLSPILEAFATSSNESSITSPEVIMSNDTSGQIEESCSIHQYSETMSDKWPTPEPRHLHLYRIHFSQHLSFIHHPSLDLQNENKDELDADLQRAMAIVGGNYESAAQGGLDQGARPLAKSCDYYGCGQLKTKTLRSIEDLQEQALNDQLPSKRVLVRRTQIMILLQLASMFSENKKHIVAAKISHGSLIAIARELLNEFNRSPSIHPKGSWNEFIQREECIRTIWTVFLLDSLHSFCYQQNPWFSLSELSNLPDLSSDDLWNAVSESQFHMLMSTHSSSMGSECIFDLVNRLKGETSMILPKQLSLSGTLLILLCIVTEIARIVKDDTITRKQLANRIQRSSPLNLSEDETNSIVQAIDSHDVRLCQDLDDADRYLSKWLTLVQFSSKHSNNQPKRETPFMSDFMPWYWAGVHFSNLLRRRISNKGKGEEDQIFTKIDQLRSRMSPITIRNDEVQNDSIGIMHLLVRIRLALQGLDGGASMQYAIGKPDFVESLPPLPSSVTICSITGLFPLKSFSQINI